MNIQEVLKLRNGTIVQDTETKERYIVFTYGRDKYLARYKYREEILHFVECEKLYKIIAPICDKLILSEYVICPDFRERDNFIYECKNGELCKGMILKVNDYSYEVVIVMKDKIEQIIITDTDMWRMRKID